MESGRRGRRRSLGKKSSLQNEKRKVQNAKWNASRWFRPADTLRFPQNFCIPHFAICLLH
jgi:hypothetical protein